MRLEDYRNLSQDELNNIKDKVSSKIEGDIPTAHLTNDDKIYFTFKKDGEIVKPDYTPIIDIRVSPSTYEQRDDKTLDYGNLDFVEDENGNRIIKADLVEEDHGYYHQMHRYQFQYEKYILEYD